MLPDLFVVVLYQYNENLYQIINTANRSLKQKIYILKYICLLFVLFFCLLLHSRFIIFYK